MNASDEGQTAEAADEPVTQAAETTTESVGQQIGDDLNIIATIAETVASVLPVGAAASAIAKGVQLAKALANDVPGAVTLLDRLKAVQTGGTPPTEEEWAALDSGVENAYERLKADTAAG